ncbi:MAG: hypothetical protein ACKVP0_05530 [Pirellulaceae bacterium]
MNPVPMQCPLCAGMIQIDPAYAGQQVGCPLCQSVMMLPPPEFFGLPTGFAGGFLSDQPPQFSPPGFPLPYPPQEFSPPGYSPPRFPQQFPPPYPQEAPATLPQLGCPMCGGAFQVSPEMAGQQVACPHCQNAVTIPGDLFGGTPTPGFAPQLAPPVPFEVPQQSLQFIRLPPGPMPGMAPQQEIPTGFAPPAMPPPAYAPPPEFGTIPGLPLGLAVAPEPQPVAPQPVGPAYPPPQPTQSTSPSAPQPAVRSDHRVDANMYPPGMGPKEVAAKKEETTTRPEERERSKDDRFPPGKERRESRKHRSSKRDKHITEREQKYPPGFQRPEDAKPEVAETRPRQTVEPPAESSPAKESPSRVDDLLPPGAVGGVLSHTVDSLLPPGAAPSRAVDALLPPGAVEAASEPAERDVGVSRHAVVDTLLPPGAPADPAAMPTEQVALPDAPPPAPKPVPVAGPGRIVVPTPDGDFVTVENKEGVKTITDRGEEIEIRKLSPEERLRRRRVKNFVMFTFAMILLGVVIFIFLRR